MRLACAALLLAVAACHDHEHDPYDNFQDCFDAHTMEESLLVNEAIVVCCLDHPIAGMTQPVCGATEADCTTYLGTNLTSGATMDEKSAACAQYINEKDQ
jgi:hypothetical protein